MASSANEDAIIMKSLKRRLTRLFLIFLGCLLLGIAVSITLTAYLKGKIEDKITSINGTVSAVTINLLKRSLTLNNLSISAKNDTLTLQPITLTLKSVSIQGVSLFELFARNKLSANEIRLDSGTVQYDKTVQKNHIENLNSTINEFVIKNISVSYVQIAVLKDSVESLSALINCHLTNVTVIAEPMNHFRYSVTEVNGLIEKIKIDQKESMYRGNIARIACNTKDKTILIDSAELIPKYGKFEFAHHLGMQTGRISMLVPKLKMEGVQFNKIADSAFIASKITIQSFALSAFRDRRVPFLRQRNVSLPMAYFLKLPWEIKVDSIVITDSEIAVEEFPEKAIASGVITFNKVNAIFTGLNNRRVEGDKPYATLVAHSVLMGRGRLRASFRFPLDGSLAYHAEGSISNMPFSALNPALTKMANVRIKTGYLKKLLFEFTYTEMVSTGTLDIAYTNLTFTGLDKNRKSTNEIKTLLLNTLIRNDRTIAESKSEAVGIIDILRDRKRLIFNVWCKSIADGIKSSLQGGSIRQEKKKISAIQKWREEFFPHPEKDSTRARELKPKIHKNLIVSLLV
jgi:hypothetical protein